MKSILSTILFACLLGFHPAGAQPGSGVVINEEGWIIESDFAFTGPMSALIRPDDGLIYLGARSGNLFRADAQGNSVQIVSTTQVAGLGYDPATGAIFLSEDFPGNIQRVDIDADTGAASAQDWVTGFHSGDDDPAGIAAVPPDYTGTLLDPGDMVSTDRGFNGPNMIYTWSPATVENEFLVLDDDGSLVDPFDIAVKGETIAIADFDEGIKLLNDDGSVSPLVTTGVSFLDAQGVVFDTRSDDLLVLDTALEGVYRVNMTSGQVTLMFSQLGSSVTSWGGVNIYDDGTTQRIVVSVTGANRVLVFSGPDFLFVDGFENLPVQNLRPENLP